MSTLAAIIYWLGVLLCIWWICLMYMRYRETRRNDVDGAINEVIARHVTLSPGRPAGPQSDMERLMVDFLEQQAEILEIDQTQRQWLLDYYTVDLIERAAQCVNWQEVVARWSDTTVRYVQEHGTAWKDRDFGHRIQACVRAEYRWRNLPRWKDYVSDLP